MPKKFNPTRLTTHPTGVNSIRQTWALLHRIKDARAAQESNDPTAQEQPETGGMAQTSTSALPPTPETP